MKQIKKLLQGADEYVLAMRQGASNAQGADIMVLSKNNGCEKAFLDLFQAKHFDKVPGCRTKKTIHAFASLGVCYKPEPNSFNSKPDIGSAGYSYLGTMQLASELEKALKVKVELRKRVVAFSASWKECQGFESFDFQSAKAANVWVWTKEMIEPTISALVLKQPHQLGDGDDENEVAGKNAEADGMQEN